MKKKIAFVVQRYGLEVNGGAELHCRQLAEHMAEQYEVEIITTKAIDYITWKNEYDMDEETIHGLLVRRFPVEKERNIKKFNLLSEKVLSGKGSEKENLRWMEEQGPYSTQLVHYVEAHQGDYAAILFFTYLYYTTFTALPKVKEKAILIPTAHDEPPIYLPIFEDFFRSPKGIFYNTEQEKAFVEEKFQNDFIWNNDGQGGVGVECPADIDADRFRKKRGIENYLIYIGRIDESKGCGALFQYFSEYKKRNPGNLELVLMGKSVMEVPQREDLHSLGFVDDSEKFDGIAGAKALILPSKYESLSMVVLEAMNLGIPVIVNGACEVLKGHCLRSDGGFYYQNYFEFEGEINYLLQHEDIRRQMGENGITYVKENYQWESICRRLGELIEQVAEEGQLT